MSDADTIAAIATAPGEGGVAIIRVSGPRCFAIADAVFQCAPPLPSSRAGGTFVAGRVLDADGSVLDEALLLVFRAPHSYTREDTIEIQGHGGPVVSRRILRRVLDAGARSAEPGEFTQRAFLNGRLDLVQAEAVLDLIRAKTDRAAAAAAEQLDGALTRRFNTLYDAVVEITANLEATLDFPEEDLPPSLLDGLSESIAAQRDVADELLAGWTEGHLLRDGVRIAIVGRPNVGKSTLMNALLGRDRAIVSHIPGTTRDLIEEGLVIGGYPIRLIDTAGIRETECAIEQEGIRRAEQQRAAADVVLYVIDASQVIDNDERMAVDAESARAVLVVANKTDLGRYADLNVFQKQPVVETSLKTGAGLHELRREILRAIEAPENRTGSGHAVIAERHRALLQSARTHLAAARAELEKPARDGSLAADELRTALDDLGRITGRIYQDDVIHNIFSRFCIGK